MGMPKMRPLQVLVSCHAQADADALGCLAIARAMYGANCTLLWPGSTDRALQEVAHERSAALGLVTAVDASESFRLVVVVDTSDARRLVHVRPWLERGVPVAAVDHHQPGPFDVAAGRRWLAPWGSCSAMMVAMLCAGASPEHEPLSPEALAAALVQSVVSGHAPCSAAVASLALGGVLGDTDSLVGPNTRPADALATAVLHLAMQHDQPGALDMTRRVVRTANSATQLSEAQRDALHQVLSSAERRRLADGRIVAVGHAAADAPCSGFGVVASVALEKLVGCDALFAVGEFETIVVVVGRSNDGSGIDCSQVLRVLGGGGHTGAAAVTLHNETLLNAKERLYGALAQTTAAAAAPTLEALAFGHPVVLRDPLTVEAARALLVLRGVRQAPLLDTDGKRVLGLMDRHVCDRAVHLKLGGARAVDFLIEAPVCQSGATPLAVGPGLLGRSARLICVVDSETGLLKGVVHRSAVMAALAHSGILQRESLLQQQVRLPLDKHLPRELYVFVRDAGRVAQEMGVVLVASGGMPRDCILGRAVRDLDVMVAGTEAKIFAAALHARFGNPAVPLLVHEAFHTAVVTLLNGYKIDVATARLEYYPEPAALPVVELSSLKMDLGRRDFTVNALAVHLTPNQFGVLEDHFNSKHDIEAKRISVLHPLSFVEDPTRLFRALRFATRFGFHLCAMTNRLAAQAAPLAFKLTGSRIWHEIVKGLEEDVPAAVIDAFHKHGLLEAVHPALHAEFRAADIEVAAESIRWMVEAKAFEGCFAARVFFVAIVWRLPEAVILQVGARLMVPPALAQFAVACRALVARWNPMAAASEVSRLLRALPSEGPAVVRALRRAGGGDWDVAVAQYCTAWRHMRPLVTGTDLKLAGMMPGPRFAVILAGLQDAVIDGLLPLAHKEAQLKWCLSQ